MDEKNLEVLRRLKEVMEREKPVEQPKKPHVPGQGFSEESEEIFRELARHKLSRPTNQKTAAAKPPKTSVPTQPPAVKRFVLNVNRSIRPLQTGHQSAVGYVITAVTPDARSVGKRSKRSVLRST